MQVDKQNHPERCSKVAIRVVFCGYFYTFSGQKLVKSCHFVVKNGQNLTQNDLLFAAN
jgi:hypothetical protein